MDDSVFIEDIFDEDGEIGAPPSAGAGTGIDIASSHLAEREPAVGPTITSYMHVKKIPSFSEPSRTSTMRAITVIIDRPGPLLMQLKMHPSRKCVMLHGFDRDEDGDRGELELSGKLRVGDLLIDINGKSLERRSFKDVLGLIRLEGASGHPRVLSLIRFSCPISEADYFGHQAGTFRDSGCYSSTEVAEDLGQYILGLLGQEGADMERLRRVAAQGLPPVPGLRALVWMALLGYLPEKHSQWDDTLAKNRSVYASLKEEFRICPSHGQEGEDLIAALPPEDGGGGRVARAEDSGDAVGERTGVSDDPLQVDRSSSQWARYFEDRELLESVEKDVVRTYPEHAFFDDRAKLALKAILFIYAKLNPGVSYVQGMNELVGTLYYVFATNGMGGDWVENAEADTFFCFTALMSEFQDLFIYRLDDTSRGLQGTIERYCQLVAAEDPHLHAELRAQGLEATFYTVRWVTTLFSREFDLLDTVRLWDALFADTDKHEFLSFMCFTMTTEQRDFIFTNEFADNLKMLQSYPLKDVPHLLEVLEATRSTVKSGRSRRPPGHPLRPDAGAPAGQAGTGASYLSATGRQMIYDQLRSVDTEAIKATSYQLLSSSVNKIMSTAGSAMEAYNSAYMNDEDESAQTPNSGSSSARTGNAAVAADEDSTAGVVRSSTPETASGMAGRWAWKSIGGLVSLASQASSQISKSLRPEEPTAAEATSNSNETGSSTPVNISTD